MEAALLLPFTTAVAARRISSFSHSRHLDALLDQEQIPRAPLQSTIHSDTQEALIDSLRQSGAKGWGAMSPHFHVQ